MIGAAMEQYSTKEWAKLLPKIAFNLNTSKSSTMKFMPYEIVFNKKPNFGNKKNAFDCDKDGNEVPCEIATVVATTSATTTSPPESTNDQEENEEENGEENENEEEENEIEEETDIRKKLRKNKEKNVEKMIKKHDHKRNRKTREFKEGDNVSVKIPRIDRGGHNFSRISGTVCKVSTVVPRYNE